MNDVHQSIIVSQPVEEGQIETKASKEPIPEGSVKEDNLLIGNKVKNPMPVICETTPGIYHDNGVLTFDSFCPCSRKKYSPGGIKIHCVCCPG